MSNWQAGALTIVLIANANWDGIDFSSYDERRKIMIYTIGLTGGIASGKSTVVQMLRSYGAAIVDCDVLARQVVAPGSPGLQAVAAAFGPKTVQADGSMDRMYIGAVIFQQPARKKQLENILFPLIRKGINDQIATYGSQKKYPVIFLDMPLLFEVKYDSYVNEAWLVYVDPATQLQRLISRNHFTESEAMARIQAQFPIDDKRALAQVIIDNTGSVEETKEQVRVQWGNLLSRIRQL
ncbi:MAG: dephospho-CoA kinase [Megasphaera sp.]|jgi:dephospho-CoA kinase|nr:dephospho-CoA kinase [Megasphaera sp.]MCH4187295.1 dephospho-CoA kinase [Megasphaera sp.]MCH4217261.1 dephospho-CoA kinase [Megasphaera sp.]